MKREILKQANNYHIGIIYMYNKNHRIVLDNPHVFASDPIVV